MPPFSLLADDLTGACDAGAPFARRGARVRVELPVSGHAGADPAALADANPAAWDVRVVDTDSRHLTPAQAGERCAQAVRQLAAAGWPLRFKKIDSTLRGHLVAELAPLLASPEKSSGSRLVVCPAFPAAGRTLESGVLRVNGVPVSETELGQDALNPVTQSHLPTLLREGLGVPVAQINPRAVPGGAEMLAQRIASRTELVLVLDAASADELAVIAGAVAEGWRLGLPLIAVGSAGLAGALAEVIFAAPQAPTPDPSRPPLNTARPGFVAVLAGSRNQITRAQIVQAAAHPDCLHRVLSPSALVQLRGRGEEDAWVGEQIKSVPAKSNPMVMFSLQPESLPLKTAQGQAVSLRLTHLLGRLARALADGGTLAGLVLTGGDVALGVLEAMECRGLRLERELLPGIPISRMIGGVADGLPVITKAGGFGAPDALNRAFAALREFPA